MKVASIPLNTLLSLRLRLRLCARVSGWRCVRAVQYRDCTSRSCVLEVKLPRMIDRKLCSASSGYLPQWAIIHYRSFMFSCLISRGFFFLFCVRDRGSGDQAGYKMHPRICPSVRLSVRPQVKMTKRGKLWFDLAETEGNLNGTELRINSSQMKTSSFSGDPFNPECQRCWEPRTKTSSHVGSSWL